ncbi:hypothetical protein QUH41_27595, partial [Klebsiella grimontii]|nr:hypothetical protein [Klebsiella grimontii]
MCIIAGMFCSAAFTLVVPQATTSIVAVLLIGMALFCIHFAGLNFTEKKLQEAVSFVHQHRRKLHIAINTFAHPDGYARW